MGRAAPPRVRDALRGARRSIAHRTAASRALPDALLIGTQRGGTTTLYHYLTQHPQFLGAVAGKEVHHFDLHAATGLNAYRGAFPRTSSVRRRERRVGAPVVVGRQPRTTSFTPPCRIASRPRSPMSG